MPARDLLRRPARGAPARGGHPAAGTRRARGDGIGDVRYLADRGAALGAGGGKARRPHLTGVTQAAGHRR
ncbi:hypothetical protein G6F22_019986 [Rhizopus arrhizus]|nr:hypothetical protein G6F22_019986 [Rhizopus arrhizus]